MFKHLISSSILLLSSFIGQSQTDIFERTDTVPVNQWGSTINLAWSGGINAAQVSRIDLDMDGTEDIFVFDRVGNRIMTFLNGGTSGTVDLTYAPEYESMFPGDIRDWCILRDYNCDGKKDIFTYVPGGIALYKNISTTPGELEFEMMTSPYLYSFQPPNNLNLYVSAVDVPSISDIDGDGDLDVLTFGVFGTTVEYHKNLSMENYGVCDSLDYELKNLCWGGFKESSVDNSVDLNYQGYPCTSGNVSNPEIAQQIQVYMDKRRQAQDDERPLPIGGGYRHTGSTLMTLDMNANGVMELVLGDVSFSNLVMLTNGGTTPNTNSMMIAFDTLFPSSSIAVDIHLFPAGFYEDINNDGLNDLIATTNAPNLSEDTASVWFYSNSGANDSPVFNFEDNNELQEDMIEVGTGAYPILFDENNDGLLDLLVSNMGYYDGGCNCYEARISLYRNTGTGTQPEFTLITRDYESMNSIGLANSMHPTFGDLDGDGDKDMMVGDGDGVLHYFENIASTGNPADFVLSQPNYLDNSNNVIDVGLYSTPYMVDLDRDGDQDLVIGERNGNLNYYENKGSSSVPSFELITDSLGGVDVRQYFELQGGTGFSVPWIIDRNGSYELFVGAKSGWIHKYDSIDGNIGGEFNQIDTMLLDYHGGKQIGLTLGDLNSDGMPEMIVGNYSGGLHFFVNSSTADNISEIPSSIDLKLFPNPADNEILVTLPLEIAQQNPMITILDIQGRVVQSQTVRSKTMRLPTDQLANGTYIIKLSGVTFYGVERFIIKH